MNRLRKKLEERIFAQDMTLEERIFNLLCFTGFFALLTTAVVRGLWIANNLPTFIYLFIVATTLGLGFIFFSRFRSRRAVMIATLCIVLGVLFPLIFFSGGGIRSGNSAYFVLSLSVLFVLLQGKTCAIMVCLHIITSMTCYYLAYTRPELVTPLSAPYMVHIDSVMSIAFSGLVLCLLVKVQTDAYIEEKRNALMAVKARSDFLANISHEIRTPLNAIIGVSAMEMRDEKSPEEADNIKQMYDSGLALLDIINDILDISKMEAGRFTILPEKYEVTSLAFDLVNMYVGLSGKDHIRFKVNISEKMPSVLYGDQTGIQQIAGNMLSNAFKYTENGSVELSISSESAPGGKQCLLKIAVNDTGRGITPEDQERIFRDYGKLDTEATALEGIGLGLTICRNLAEMMGGYIDVQSTLNVGSKFTVIIPQKVIDPTPIGKENARRINAVPNMV